MTTHIKKFSKKIFLRCYSDWSVLKRFFLTLFFKPLLSNRCLIVLIADHHHLIYETLFSGTWEQTSYEWFETAVQLVNSLPNFEQQAL